MRSSPLSLAFVYFALGGLSVSGIGGHRALSPVAWVLAGLLVAAGALLLTRTRAAFWIALVVAAVTAASGVMPLVHHPELSLPLHPAATIGVSLYLVLRIGMAASAFGVKPRGFIPRDDPDDKDQK